MAIPQDKLSDEFVDGVYIPPEERDRVDLLEDYEGGPIGITDTTEGMNYQTWYLQYTDPNFTVYPETTGGSSVILTAAGAEQVSFCFDQNARPSAVYIVGTSAFLYWYDTVAVDYVTTEFTNVVSAILSLDDKREMEVGVNDILFWYTKETSPGVYDLFHRKQRDRFLTEYPMTTGCYPYLYKAGMHNGLRGKIQLIDNLPQ